MNKRRLPLAAIGVFLLAAPALKPATLPRPAPDFPIQVSKDKQVRLSEYKGKVVTLLFILTSCPHCQTAVRILSQCQRDLGPRGLQTIAVAIEDMAEINVPGFVRSFDPPFPVGWSKLAPALDFMQHPPMVGPRMPLVAFVDRGGVIRAQYEGQESFFDDAQMAKNLRDKILDLLGESPPAAGKAAPKKAAPAKKKS